jgi:hypothetical protein
VELLDMNGAINSILPMLGIVVGALLQFWFGRTAEKGKHVTAMRAEAYTDYLRAVVASGFLRSDEDLVEALKSASDAKLRILVYGDIKVIAALARFEEAGPTLDNSRSTAAFFNLVSAMRSRHLAVSEDEIKLILFGSGDLKSQHANVH